MLVWCPCTLKTYPFPECAASLLQGERGSRKGLPLEARADLWLFIMVLPLSQLVWPHLNTILSAANPTQELFLSVALHFSSITTCLHANLLRSQQPHHPIYTLHCQIITLLCHLQHLMCFKTKSTTGCPGEEWACVTGALPGVPSWGCCRAAPILGNELLLLLLVVGCG